MATATALLKALAAGQEASAWEAARDLASGVLDDNKVTLAKAVLEAGPFALRRAVELAEAVLQEERTEVAGTGST